MSVDQFCLKWNNYQASLTNAFKSLLENEDFVDVTLSAGGRTLRAHKVVLSACSSYFKQLLRGISSWQHPILFLRDVPFVDLYTILEFIYMGEVNVAQSDLTSFLKTAELLQIKGLAENASSWSGDDGDHEMSSSSATSTAAGGQPGLKRRRLSSEASSCSGKLLNDSLASTTAETADRSVSITADSRTASVDVKEEAPDDDEEESALCVDESAIDADDGEMLLVSEDHNGTLSTGGSSPKGVLMGPNHKKCEQCDIVMLKKNFARHQRDMHTEPKPRSLCPLCQKSYKTSDWLKDHIRRGHGYTKELTDQLMATIKASSPTKPITQPKTPSILPLENGLKITKTSSKDPSNKQSVAVIDIQQQPMTILNSAALTIVKQENNIST